MRNFELSAHKYRVQPAQRAKGNFSETNRGITIWLLQFAIGQTFPDKKKPAEINMIADVQDEIARAVEIEGKELDSIELDERTIREIVAVSLDEKNDKLNIPSNFAGWYRALNTYVKALLATFDAEKEAAEAAKKNGTGKPTAEPVKVGA